MFETYLKDNYGRLAKMAHSHCNDIFITSFVPISICIASLVSYPLITDKVIVTFINIALAITFSVLFSIGAIGICTMNFLIFCWLIILLMLLVDSFELFLIILPMGFIIPLMISLFIMFQHQFHNK